METGEIMTVTDVSRVLQVSSRQVYRLMAEGHLKYSRLGPGGDRRIRAADVQEMLSENSIIPETERE
jgi:excisionase family DNA binding protein|tara:strand:- start:364 stop:564 length:201 start_codon:yes stop_codon:yes gene_type:complete